MADIHQGVHWLNGIRPRLALAVAASRAAGAISAASGKGGTSLPGLVGLQIEPRMVRLLARQLRGGSIVVAGTNGKTTTAALTSACLRASGNTILHNRAGSNMARGIASVLARQSALSGRLNSSEQLTGLFEVDEAALPAMLQEIAPRILVLTNLFRDQLDRYGELATTAERWREAIRGLKDTLIVLNADDPLVASLGDAAPGPVRFYGVGTWEEGTSTVSNVPVQSADSLYCPRCETMLHFESIAYAHLGHYRCPSCDFTRPRPTVVGNVLRSDSRSSRIEVHADGASQVLELSLPGRYSVYNAVAAIAAATSDGTDLETTVNAVAAARGAFGRAERLVVLDRIVELFLIKNPAGADEVFRVVASSDRTQTLLLLLSDNAADGEDISWIWDAELEILAPWQGKVICGGTRAEDLALRAKYAELDANVTIVSGDVGAAVVTLLNEMRSGQSLTILATYTAMLAARNTLARAGKLDQFWEAQP